MKARNSDFQEKRVRETDNKEANKARTRGVAQMIAN
jgi:hypothetical protein